MPGPFVLAPGIPVTSQATWYSQPHPAPTNPPDSWLPLPVAPPKVESIAAWILAGTPLLWLLISIVVLQSGISDAVLTLPLLLASWLLCAWDISNVRRAGLKVSAGMWFTAVLVPPAYLVQRTLRTKQTWWIPALWGITFVIALAMTPLIGILGGVELDTPYVEDTIETHLDESLGRTGAEVTCPEPAIAPVGAFFECDARYPDGTTGTIIVSVLDWTGGFSWES